MGNIEENIITLIEKKRKELNKLAKKKEKFDDHVIKKSQELDLLLNIFHDKLNKKAQ